MKVVAGTLAIGDAMHRVYRAGTGSVTVVFESAIGDVGLTWGLVQPEVAEFSATFAHDRPGLGGSAPSTRPRDAATLAEELHGTLLAAGVRPPILLVGHSFASLAVQLFAHRFSDDLVGVVLVDGAHEDQMERFPPELDPGPVLAGVASQLRQMAETARSGVEVPELVVPPGTFPEVLAEDYRIATSPTAVHLDTVASEYESLEASRQAVRSLVAAAPMLLGDIPSIVIRHGVPQIAPGVADEVNDRYEIAWQQMQDELAARSSHGLVRVADGAGHNIHHETPGVLVEAIRNLIGA